MTIKIGIMGYGNLGRGIECAIKQNSDIQLKVVFTRRDPKALQILTEGVPVCAASEAERFVGELDVLMVCGGSATDLPEMTKKYAEYFNVVDSFDTHANIPSHFSAVDQAAKKAGTTAMISAGWDPGMFSLNRLYANCILPEGKDYTFWGRGVSQGHSDAIRRIDGVLDARQYTVPVDETLQSARLGEGKSFTAREMHTRECYVVAAQGADKAKIEREIKTMPNYFADYDTTVHFITMDELKQNHNGIPHGGFVIRSGKTGLNMENKHTIEYRLDLDSNPEFTSSVLVAAARATYRMNKEGKTGCITLFDVPPAYLSPLSGDQLRAHML